MCGRPRVHFCISRMTLSQANIAETYLRQKAGVCGVTGLIQPTLSALLHNASTLGISLRSMTDLLHEEDAKHAALPEPRRA